MRLRGDVEHAVDEVSVRIRSDRRRSVFGSDYFFHFFDGSWTLDFAISEIKKNSRRFAKRQLTWFRKDRNILWFDYLTEVHQIISELNKIIINN